MKRILVGLDGSSRAPHVLATALSIARSQGARIILLRSVGIPPEVPRDLWKESEEPLLQTLCDNARAYLEAQATGIPADVLEKTEVPVGVPWQSICNVARRDGADLVVVGSHGYAGLDHLLGTTAAKVVNHSPCSVLVVR